MIDYDELRLPDEWSGINPTNGQFLPGHTPYNKGKKWSELLTKKAQKRCAKGWKNLKLYRPTTRPDNAGRCRKPVICINLEGHWTQYPYISRAAECLGIMRENIRRCCKQNSMQHVHQKTGKVNTDHQYMGLRFYYESDSHIWRSKIEQDCEPSSHTKYTKHYEQGKA